MANKPQAQPLSRHPHPNLKCDNSNWQKTRSAMPRVYYLHNLKSEINPLELGSSVL